MTLNHISIWWYLVIKFPMISLFAIGKLMMCVFGCSVMLIRWWSVFPLILCVMAWNIIRFVKFWVAEVGVVSLFWGILVSIKSRSVLILKISSYKVLWFEIILIAKISISSPCIKSHRSWKRSRWAKILISIIRWSKRSKWLTKSTRVQRSSIIWKHSIRIHWGPAINSEMASPIT